MQNAFPFLILPITRAYLYIFHGGNQALELLNMLPLSKD